MSNIRRIAFNEWRAAFRSRTVFISAVVLGFSLLTALVVSWQNARLLNAERTKFQEIVRTNWIDQPDRHPHRVAHYGYLAFRPKSTLSFFDSGIDSFAGTSVFLEAHRQNTANFSEARHSSGLLRFGELNLAMILQILVPLLIFFLGFSSVAGEREGGTLALMMAQGVSPGQLIAGKSAGVLGTVLALALPLMLIAFGMWLALNDFTVSADAAIRILLLIAGYLLYFAVTAALAVVVSAISPTSRTALTALLVIWIVFWIAMPRAAQNVGAAIYPAPTKAEFDKRLEADLANEGDSHNPNDPKFAELRRETLAEHGVDDVKKLPFNYAGFVMMKAEEISSGIFRRHFGELIAQYRRQNRVSELLSLVNPYLAIRQFSMAVAGSDFTTYEHFATQTEDYRFKMAQRLNDLHMNEIKAEKDREQKVGRETWERFPAFEYREPPIAETVRQQIPALISVAFWTIAAFGAVAYAGRRRLLD